MPTSTTPSALRAGQRTSTVERRRHAAAAAASASPTTATKTTPGTSKTTPSTTPKSQGKSGGSSTAEKPPSPLSPNANEDGEDGEEDENEKSRLEKERQMEERLSDMEVRFEKAMTERNAMRNEIRDLRDRLEEEEFSKIRLEGRVKEVEEEAKSLRAELDETKNDLRVKMQEQQRQQQQQQQTRQPQQQTQQLNNSTTQQLNNSTTQQQQNKRRCVIITDSNGRGATSDSIRNHIPIAERERYNIEVAVAYTTDEAYQRITRGAIDVRDAVVIIDNLTNDIRGTRVRTSLSPNELLQRVDQLREKMKMEGAFAVVVCQVKPMQMMDVTPYNGLISDSLSAQRWGFGCQTQIRLSYLKADGFHVLPQFDSIIDKTYACAIRGVLVPDPTPLGGFIPDHLKRRWQAKWPRLGGGGGGRDSDRINYG